MKAEWQYLKYVVRHKWFVFWACLELGVPFWRALSHDWSKLLPSEFIPYVHAFYLPDGSKRKVRDDSGSYNPLHVFENGFDGAWLQHVHFNPHHWQYWIVIGDAGELKPLVIPDTYLREMLADWVGAGGAQNGSLNPTDWYVKNRAKIVMEENSRAILESKMIAYLIKHDWIASAQSIVLMQIESKQEKS